MASLQTATEILDQDFLTVRARLIDIAAALDRIDRAGSDGMAGNDARRKQLREAIEILLDDRADRVAQIQLAFSDAYDADWRRTEKS